ncbi:MAG TPA: DsbE family thiol:disulfide interchange protein [Stellaceae bacterium]|nr:DsbE family thiol:disulfide interchange protein [Stellaceae bacterium]
MKRLAFLLLPAAFFGLVAVFGLGLGHDPQLLPSAMIGRPAPQFALPGLDGKPNGLARADLSGVTLINFFASWCIPCRQEAPQLMALGRRPDLTLDGILYEDTPENGQRLLASDGNPYRHIGVDAKGRTAIDFGVYGVPETYVVDRRGRIRYRAVGPLTTREITDKILPLLAELAAEAKKAADQGSGSRSSLDTAARKPGRSGQP